VKRSTRKRIRLYWNDIHAIQRKTGKTSATARRAYRKIVRKAGGRSQISRDDILSIGLGKKYKCPAQGAFRKYVDRYDTPDGRRDLIIFLDCVPSAQYRMLHHRKRYVFPVNVGRKTREQAERKTDAQWVEFARMKMQSSEMRIATIKLAGKGWLKDRRDREGIRLSGKHSRRDKRWRKARGKRGHQGNRTHRTRSI